MMTGVATSITDRSKPGLSASTAPFVLVVDDHAPTLSKLKSLVEITLEDYQCVAIPSAPEALIYCDRYRPSVVITDFSMPNLNGDGLARWLKSRYPTVPILLVTGELLDDETLKTFEGTFAAVIRKPLDVDPFVAILTRLARPHRSDRVAELNGFYRCGPF